MKTEGICRGYGWLAVAGGLLLASLAVSWNTGCAKPSPTDGGTSAAKGTDLAEDMQPSQATGEEQPPVGDSAAAPAAPGNQADSVTKSDDSVRHVDTPMPTDAPAASDNASSGNDADDSESAPHGDAAPADDKPLFADWPEPAAVLFITGRQDGYIEPCGCTGLANQKGGLARRFTFLKQLRDEKQWPVVAVDAGNQVRRFGVQPVFKFQRTADALKQMKYDAVAFGRDDLRLPAGELFAVVADQNQDGSTPFISANVALLDESFTPRYRVVEAGGKKIGITTILGDEFVSRIKSDEVPTVSVAEGLNKVWPKLEAEGCDLYLLLAHASLEESAAIAREFPKFDFIVTAGGLGEPTHEPQPIDNLPDGSTTRMIQVGTKGMYAGVLGIFPDASDKFRYQRVPLTDQYADAPEMRRLMKGYQDQLEAVGLAGLEVKPIPHPSGNRYVGSESCGACHEDAYEVWKDSAHAHALDSLVHPGERSDIARHHDPECLSCHVTGWNPQKYYPYTSGYLSLEETPRMAHSGCENCHGPGSAHVAAETGNEDVSEMEILARRAAMVLKLEDAERRCMDCHDLDNSPDFHDEGAFQKYWDQIAH